MDAKVRDTASFISRASSIHSNKYDYSLVEYIKSLVKVKIICPVHGAFEQSPNNHLSGYGCKKCASPNPWSKEKFLEELKNKCGEIDFEVIGEYKGTQNNILTKDKYGVCSSRANHLLSGNIPSIRTAINKTEYWINMAKEVHGSRYDYSKVIFKNVSTKVDILCNIHGLFSQKTGSHLSGSGCPECYRISNGQEVNKKYMETFIQRANNVHNYRYGYILPENFKAKDKVEIKCPTHGSFKQLADNHLQGDRCPKCGIEELKLRMIETPTGWQWDSWEAQSKKSKNFDCFKIYVIECWDEGERFYKVGKTFQTVEKRFKGKKDMPYNFKIVFEATSTPKICSELESQIKNKNSDYRIVPKIFFNGINESLQDIDINFLYEVEKTKGVEIRNRDILDSFEKGLHV